jgi:hypothetical protein
MQGNRCTMPARRLRDCAAAHTSGETLLVDGNQSFNRESGTPSETARAYKYRAHKVAGTHINVPVTLTFLQRSQFITAMLFSLLHTRARTCRPQPLQLPQRVRTTSLDGQQLPPTGTTGNEPCSIKAGRIANSQQHNGNTRLLRQQSCESDAA